MRWLLEFPPPRLHFLGGFDIDKRGQSRGEAMQKRLYAIIIVIASVWGVTAGAWPLVEHRGDINAVQQVWDRWQAWNTGVIALLSALTALAVTRLRDDRERERAFVAAKALLPDHLSSLLAYVRSSQFFLTGAYQSARGEEIELPELPARPVGYEQWVSDAIRWGDPDFVAYMAHVVSHLQVYRSRIQELPFLHGDPEERLFAPNVRDYIIQGAVIYTQLGNLLGFSRDNENLPEAVTARDLASSLRLCGIYFLDHFEITDDLLERRAGRETKSLRSRRRGVPDER